MYKRQVDDVLGRVHPRLHTPVAATVLVGLVAAVAAAFLPLDWLVNATGATTVVLYLMVACAALRLRRRGAPTSRGYRMRLWPLAPLVVIAVCLYVCYQLITPGTWVQLAIAVGTLVAGALYYIAYLYPRRADRWTLPDPIHEDV